MRARRLLSVLAAIVPAAGCGQGRIDLSTDQDGPVAADGVTTVELTADVSGLQDSGRVVVSFRAGVPLLFPRREDAIPDYEGLRQVGSDEIDVEVRDGIARVYLLAPIEEATLEVEASVLPRARPRSGHRSNRGEVRAPAARVRRRHGRRHPGGGGSQLPVRVCRRQHRRVRDTAPGHRRALQRGPPRPRGPDHPHVPLHFDVEAGRIVDSCRRTPRPRASSSIWRLRCSTGGPPMWRRFRPRSRSPSRGPGYARRRRAEPPRRAGHHPRRRARARGIHRRQRQRRLGPRASRTSTRASPSSTLTTTASTTRR